MSSFINEQQPHFPSNWFIMGDRIMYIKLEGKNNSIKKTFSSNRNQLRQGDRDLLDSAARR